MWLVNKEGTGQQQTTACKDKPTGPWEHTRRERTTWQPRTPDSRPPLFLPPYTHVLSTYKTRTHITHTTSSCQSRPQDTPKHRFCLLQATLRHVTHTLPVLSPLPLLYPFTFPWIASFPALYIINSYPSSLPPFLAAPHHISWHHFPFPSQPPPDPSLDFSPPSPPSPNTSPWSLPLPHLWWLSAPSQFSFSPLPSLSVSP